MLIDAHAHLDMYTTNDLPRALAELEQARIFTVSVSMDPDSYICTRALAEGQRWVLPTFGIHPWRAAAWADRLEEIAPLVDESPMLGEIGLDYHWVEDETTYPRQRHVLAYFLQAASKQDKIVNLHTKGAELDVLNLLRKHDVRRAIVHWYSGPMGAFNALLEYGAYFTVGVEVLQSRKIRKIARRIPPDRLLTETDNPGGWEWFNPGEVGMPHVIEPVIDALADVRQLARDEVIALVRANLLNLIGDDTRLASIADFLQGA